MAESKEIEKLQDQMFDTSKTLTTVTFAVDNINKNLEILVQSDASTQKALIEHWHNQETILRDLADDKKRINNLEATQNKGCNALENAVKFREFETNALKEKNELLKIATSRSREEIDKLLLVVTTLSDSQRTQSNEIKDLEINQNKGMWLIITAFLGIIITFIKGSLH